MEKIVESPVKLSKKNSDALTGMFGGNVANIKTACDNYRSEKSENRKITNLSKGKNSVDIRKVKALIAAGIIALGISTGAIVTHINNNQQEVPEWFDPNAHLDLLSDREDFFSHVILANNYLISGEVYSNSDASNYAYIINEPVEGFMSKIAVITKGINGNDHILDLYETKTDENGKVIVERFNNNGGFSARDVRTMLLENGLNSNDVERIMGYFDGIGWIEVNQNNFQDLYNNVLAERASMVDESLNKTV